MSEVLSGRRRGLLATLPFFGPALVASVAYTDPGNFATNIQAGAAYGYTLLWVVLAANLIAMLFQAMSAKIGIVTGRNLAELCRDNFPQPLVVAMWLASEVAAMATDLAEFLGGAIGLSLLLHLPLLGGMAVTGVITYVLLLLDSGGFRPLELVIGGLVAAIGVCYLAELFIVPPDWRMTLAGSVIPRLPDQGAVTLAVGIVGATVMPHAIYLHSSLTQNRIPIRTDADRAMLIRFSNREVLGALTLAGMVNAAMVMMAASAFHAGHPEVAEIETAYHTLAPLLGGAAAAGDNAAGLRRGGRRCERDAGAGDQPGGAEPGAAGANGGAAVAEPSARGDGGIRDGARYEFAGGFGYRGYLGVEWGFAGADCGGRITETEKG